MVKRSLFARQGGFSLVEILVTLVIVMIGLMGLAGVQMRAHQAELESYQRAQAVILVSDMVDRISANRRSPSVECYAVTTFSALTLGTGAGNAPAPACNKGLVELQQIALDDLNAWDAMLKGAGEKIAGVDVATMVGARGCINWDAALGMYRVSVAWQGTAMTEAPDVVTVGADGISRGDAKATCGKNLYGDEKLRREVSANIRIATLK